MKMQHLVLLIDETCTHKVLDDGTGTRNVGVMVQVMKRLLNALVSYVVGSYQDGWQVW